MTSRPTVLCPIDFSAASRTALGYAAAIADHFGARLQLLTVDDPLLAEASAMTGQTPPLQDVTLEELRRFAAPLLSARSDAMTVAYDVTVGKPGPEILRVARESAAELIVMSSGGRRGVRKLFFGSTAERVLRDAPVPVLVTQDDRQRTGSLSELARDTHRVLVPVDLTAASHHQVAVAAGLASALSVPWLLAHVLEPVHLPATVRLEASFDAARRATVEDRLAAIARGAASPPAETLVLTGEPSEEIAKLADVRAAGLIVIGLHSSGPLAPRMGSVTYRVLCLTHALVLALPPRA